jgi:hypothetical protein
VRKTEKESEKDEEGGREREKEIKRELLLLFLKGMKGAWHLLVIYY